MSWINPLLLFCALLVLPYLWLISTLSRGWFRIPFQPKTGTQAQLKLLVLIPVHNEAKHLQGLLQGLLAQDYPRTHFKIVIINDRSTDSSPKIVEAFIQAHPQLPLQLLNITSVPPLLSPKKNAIHQALKQQHADWVVCTDGDCTHEPGWLSSLAQMATQKELKMIAGPVTYYAHRGTGLFARLQALEFLSLIGSGAGGIEQNHAFMCNGANLAFEMAAWQKVNPAIEGQSLASGDDVFLLHAIKRQYGPSSIRFLKARQALVKTRAVNSLNQFIQQRKRWTSKSKSYTDTDAIGIACLVFLINAGILILFAMALLAPVYWPCFLLVLGAKILIDFPLLWSITRFTRQSYLMLYYPLLVPIYSLYICGIALSGLFGRFRWKGLMGGGL